MAKIGLKYPVYAIATETTSAISYAGGAVLAKAIKADINIETNSTELYCDDALGESDHSFSSGTLTFEIDDLTNAAQKALLGYTEGDTVDATLGTKEMKATASANIAYVGFGFYGRKIVANVTKWRAIWIKKMQFSEPKDELSTKGKSVEFATVTLEGTIMVAADGLWKEEATFATEAACKAWLDGKCGLAAKVAAPVSSVASGTYTAAQSVTLSSATAGSAIYYTTDGTIPSAANGTLYSTAIACAKPSIKCIKAVATKAGSTNSDIIELYITVTA